MQKKAAKTQLKRKNTASYTKNQKRLDILNSKDVYKMSDNEIAASLLEVASIKKIVYKLFSKYDYLVKKETTNTSPTSNTMFGKKGLNGSLESKFSLMTNSMNMISGEAKFTVSNSDYHSLLNEAVARAIINFRRNIRYTKLMEELKSLCLSFNKDRSIIPSKVPNLQKFPLMELEGEEFFVAKYNLIVNQIRDIGIKKKRNIKSLKQITSYMIETFKSKHINEGQAIVLRRRMNSRKPNETKEDVYKADVEDRRMFILNEVLNSRDHEGEDKENLDTFDSLLNQDISNSEVLLKMIESKNLKMKVPLKTAQKLLDKYRKEREEELERLENQNLVA